MEYSVLLCVCTSKPTEDFLHVYLVSLGITESLLLHAQVTDLRHELVWVNEEARAE